MDSGSEKDREHTQQGSMPLELGQRGTGSGSMRNLKQITYAVEEKLCAADESYSIMEMMPATSW